MRRRLTSQVLLTAALLAIVASGSAQVASQSKQEAVADPYAAIRANNLGAAYMNQQRMEQALGEFQRAAALDPKLTAARLNQGIALLNLQRIEAARAILREVAERDAKNIRAWYNLGLLEKNAGEAEVALAAFERAAALDPADPDTHYFIGTLHAQQNRFAEAIAAFEQAIARNKFHVSAEFGLARALQRTGEVEKARAHLARFQHLNTEKLGAPLSLAYGDQGPYSLAETVTLPPAAAPPPIPVKFTPVPASDSGLDFRLPAHGGEDPPNLPWIWDACAFDFDQDGHGDLYLPTGNLFERSGRLFRGTGTRFEDVTEKAGLGKGDLTMKCAAGDYDNDGWPDLVISGQEQLRLFRNRGDGTFQDVTPSREFREIGLATRLVFVDFDHDGDLDLYVVRGSKPNVMLRNNGNGEFTDVTSELNLGGGSGAWDAIATDFNNDRAIDLVVALGKQPLKIYLNPREGSFPVLALQSAGPAGATRIVTVDYDGDSWMDLAIAGGEAFASEGESEPTVWRNMQGRDLEHVSWSGWNARPVSNLAALDYDNDGTTDLVVAGRTAHGEPLRILRNEGSQKGRWREAATLDLGLPRLGPISGILPIDFDSDGDLDLLVVQALGNPLLFRNEGGNKNNWLKLSLKGLADNKSAMGTKVEVFAGASYQKFEVTTPNDLLIGLGQEKQADVVRLLWPTGVLQDEVNLAANQRHVITQIDRRGSSCPVLFAWNGERFEFIADAIGPGIVGHWVAPGVRNTSDPTEYLKVPGTLLRERRGAHGERLLSFRFAEPMEEIVYLDQLRLLAIDHPADTDVNPSERFYASGPPFPTGEPVFTHRAHARPPAQAWNHRGQEVTALLRERDRRYVSDFADAPYKGFAELHWIELELGEAAGAPLVAAQGSGASAAPTASPPPLRLLLHGFTDYFTATSVYAAHQGGVTAIVPYVEAQLADGAWQRVVDDMGFPAGLARTMVADLTGKLPAGTRRIRIATNLKVYWDQVLIDTTPPGTPHRITEARLAAASAGYLGYPREIRGTPESDVRYDYHTVSATGPYARAAGHYTRYGDVRALVAQADDRFVIMGSGDEVAVDFDASALPPVPEGWRRNWFFYVDGFAKDMDFYAAHPFTTTPLPYHAMPGYPYPPERSYPDRGAHLEDQLELNTRPVSGRAAPSYRYAYPR